MNEIFLGRNHYIYFLIYLKQIQLEYKLFTYVSVFLENEFSLIL